MGRNKRRRRQHERSAAAASFSLTASILALPYRKKGEENVVLAAPCGAAASMWFFAGGPIFGLLGLGTSASLDALGVGSAPAWAVGIFALAMAMAAVAGFFVLLGQSDSEFCWKHESAALAISVLASLLIASA